MSHGWDEAFSFHAAKTNLKKTTNISASGTTTPQSHISPFSPAKHTVQSGNTPFKRQRDALRAVFVYWQTLSNFPPLWVSDWGATESERHCELSFVSFQIHSRETLTKSISLPRSAYWQHITRQNSVGDLYSYQGTGTKLLIITRASAAISSPACGSVKQDSWRNGKAKEEGKLHPYVWTCLSEFIRILF